MWESIIDPAGYDPSYVPVSLGMCLVGTGTCLACNTFFWVRRFNWFVTFTWGTSDWIPQYIWITVSCTRSSLNFLPRVVHLPVHVLDTPRRLKTRCARRIRIHNTSGTNERQRPLFRSLGNRPLHHHVSTPTPPMTQCALSLGMRFPIIK